MDFQQSFRRTCDRASSQLAVFADNVGTSIPGATDQLKTVLEKAAEFQGVVGTHGRLHVMYEASPPMYDNSADFLYAPFTQSQVYILFSPSVIFQGEKRVNATTQLISAINAFSLLMHERPAPCTTTHAPLPSPERLRPPLAPPPPWYPGKRYQSGPQVSDDALRVSERVFALFKPFDMTYIHKIYRNLFTRMHARIKAAKNGNLQGSVVYERFTPPWIRKKIVFGEKGVTFGEAILPDIHRMRNNAGTRRLKLILAAFYEREVLARNILDDILPTFAARRREERMMKETASLRIDGQQSGEMPVKKASTGPAPSGSSAASPGLIPGIGTAAERASMINPAKAALASSSAHAAQHANMPKDGGLFIRPSNTGGQASVTPHGGIAGNSSQARINGNGSLVAGGGQAGVPNGMQAGADVGGAKKAGVPVPRAGMNTSQMMFNVGKQVAMVHAGRGGAGPMVSQATSAAVAEDVAMVNANGGPSNAQPQMSVPMPMQVDMQMLQAHGQGPGHSNGDMGAVPSDSGIELSRDVTVMEDRGDASGAARLSNADGRGRIDVDIRGTKRKHPSPDLGMDGSKNPPRRQRSMGEGGGREDGGSDEKHGGMRVVDPAKMTDVGNDLTRIDVVRREHHAQRHQQVPRSSGVENDGDASSAGHNRSKNEGTSGIDEDAPSEEAREAAEEDRSRSTGEAEGTDNINRR